MFRVLLLALALFASTEALRLPAATPQVASRAAAAQMALPKLDDARTLSTDEIEAEIAAAKKARATPSAARLSARQCRTAFTSY